MRSRNSLLYSLILLFAGTSLALGGPKEWRSAQFGFLISYEANTWTASAPEKVDVRPMALAFMAMDTNRSARIVVRVSPLAPEERLNDEALQRFSDGFARSAARAGKANTVEWTQKDFAETMPCEFLVHYAEPRPGAFMFGRLVVYHSLLFQVIAMGENSTDAIRDDALRVVRSVTFK